VQVHVLVSGVGGLVDGASADAVAPSTAVSADASIA
jgi:hypothetical protein